MNHTIFYSCMVLLLGCGGTQTAQVTHQDLASVEGETTVEVIRGEVPAEEPAASTPPPPPPYVEVTGFSTPESVLVGPESATYLVSNINGSPFDEDDNGFISKVNVDGSIADLKWIDGAKPEYTLNAPKGMGIRGNELLVADINVVRVFNLDTGSFVRNINVRGASFLNDIAVFNDIAYVSDTGVDSSFKPNGKHAIYEISKSNRVTKRFADANIEGANGVFANENGVYVATFTGNTLTLLKGTSKTTFGTVPVGGLDGIGQLEDGRMVVSSWEGKAIYAAKAGEPFVILFDNIETPADISVDQVNHRVLVPLFMGNTVRFYSY